MTHSRRRFLKRAGGVGVLVVGAGCTGGQGDGGDGNGSDGTTADETTVAATTGGTTSGPATTVGETTVNEAVDGETTAANESTATATTIGDGESRGSPTAVAVGPNGDLVFEPEAIEVAIGDTVVWNFESPGHNVSARPGASDKVSIPDGAEPFASYEGDKSYQVVEEGESYEHTFETAGEYTYVCVPHAGQGMIGTVSVSG